MKQNVSPEFNDTNSIYDSRWRLLVCFFLPGTLYLINKGLIVFRDQLVPPWFATVFFGGLVLAWCCFGLTWLYWIMFLEETRFIKINIILPNLIIFILVITLNFHASNGTLGDIKFLG